MGLHDSSWICDIIDSSWIHDIIYSSWKHYTMETFNKIVLFQICFSIQNYDVNNISLFNIKKKSDYVTLYHMNGT